MSSSLGYIQLFAESLFGGDSDRCVFVSPSQGKISLARLIYILSKIIENNEQIDTQSAIISGSSTPSSAISLIAAMCLGIKVSIVDGQPESGATNIQSFTEMVEAILLSSIEELAYPLDRKILERVKILFIKNALGFTVELQTSGTTGKSSKVLLDAQSLCYQAVEVASAIKLNSSDRQLMYMPINYVYGLSVLMTGFYSRSILVETAFNMENPKSFFDQLLENQITVFSGVPYVYNMIAKRWGIENLSNSHLRIMTQAGGLLGEDVKNALLGSDASFDFWVMYGQTEFGGRISQINLSENRSMIRSVGLPLEGTSIEVIVDAESQVPEGEIFVHSPSAANNIGVLARSIQIHDKTYYSTGDIGYIGDGYIHVTGRNKNFIKAAGKRVNLANVEKEFRSLPDVFDCVVEFDESRFPLFLVGIMSESFKRFGVQQEVKTYLNGLFEDDDHIKKILVGVPYYVYIIHGSPPKLPSNKLDVCKLKAVIKESYYGKKPLHIWL